MNPVEVDSAAITAELAGAAGAIEAEQLAAAEAEVAAVSDPGAWRDGAALVVDLLDAKVCPNWALRADEKERLTDSFALVLDRYFPGALQGIEKWHPLAQLGWVAGSIAITRLDFGSGRFKPLHQEEPRGDSAEAGRPADGDNGRLAFGEDGKRLTPD